MSNQLVKIMMMAMSIFLFSCAGPVLTLQEYKAEQIVHYSQMHNIEDVSSYAFYLNEGDQIPVKISLNSELAAIADGEIHLVLKQKVFFRIKMPEGINTENQSNLSEVNKEKFLKDIRIYVSADAKSWAPYTNIRAVKQVFGITGGSFSFGMGASKDDGIAFYINTSTTSK